MSNSNVNKLLTRLSKAPKSKAMTASNKHWWPWRGALILPSGHQIQNYGIKGIVERKLDSRHREGKGFVWNHTASFWSVWIQTLPLTCPCPFWCLHAVSASWQVRTWTDQEAKYAGPFREKLTCGLAHGSPPAKTHNRVGMHQRDLEWEKPDTAESVLCEGQGQARIA